MSPNLNKVIFNVKTLKITMNNEIIQKKEFKNHLNHNLTFLL